MRIAENILIDRSGVEITPLPHRIGLVGVGLVFYKTRDEMIERSKVFEIAPMEKEEMALAEWAFNSHYWVEDPAGYFNCKYCGRKHTSVMPIMRGYPLCPDNPYIRNYMADVASGR